MTKFNIIEKKSKAEREKDDLINTFVTRKELEEIIPVVKNLINNLLHHVTALTNIMETKEIVTKEEINEELENIVQLLKDSRKIN